jgi:release factor glutamine methyltransferase
VESSSLEVTITATHIDATMATIKQVLREARGRIDAVDARVLLRHALQVDNEYLATHPERQLDAAEQARFAALLTRRSAGEPVAYIIGTREFYGLQFKVTAEVLIPRPETELLVELALQRMPEKRHMRVLDLGTGSGAIAVALAYHRPVAQITATDASAAALAIARENAERLLDTPRLVAWQGDWYSALGDEKFDLIVSNPPYVAATDRHLQQGDLRFEPLAALAGGADGLDNLHIIVAAAPGHLNSGGWLLCEHGYDQAPQVQALFTDAGFSGVFSALDLAGIPRVTGGRLRS